MAVAMIYPEPERTAPGKRAKSTTLLETKGVSAALLSQARLVISQAPDIAPNVLSGSTPLDSAYEVARERKALADAETAQMGELQNGARPIFTPWTRQNAATGTEG
jgi:hypothetical protein